MGDESGDEDSDMPAFSADQREWIERLVASKLAQTTDSSSRKAAVTTPVTTAAAGDTPSGMYSLGGGGGGGGSLGQTRCDLAEKVLNYKVLNYKDTGKGDNQRGAKGQRRWRAVQVLVDSQGGSPWGTSRVFFRGGGRGGGIRPPLEHLCPPLGLQK